MPALTIRQPGQTPQIVPLVKGLTSVGAGEDHDVALSDPSVGGEVMAVENQNGLYSASAAAGAGFYVNGKRVARHRLSDGDLLRLGQTEVVFHVRMPARPSVETNTPPPE